MRGERKGDFLAAGMTAYRGRDFRASFATSALRCFFFFLLALVSISSAHAACIGAVAEGGSPLRLVAAKPEGAVGITFLGHASFLIESPSGVRIVTDYNDLIRASTVPDIVTMNNAHSTHYTDVIEPGVKFVLRGWG